jgi:hypothetical protein
MMVTIRSSSSEVSSPALGHELGPGVFEMGQEETVLPFVEIDIGFLADQVRVSSSDALDLSQGIHDFLLALNIGVEQT